MTSNELKELVKAHFSLVEAKFGEIMDENKAFTILFEGDTLEVGKEVKVRTTDGQELTAPDGYHKLENGSTIKVEGGVVVEIADTPTEEGETEMKDVEQPSQEENTIVESTFEEEVVEVSAPVEVAPIVEEVAQAVIEAVKDEITAMKEEIETMKKKMASLEDAPATEKAMPEKMSSSTKEIKPTAGVFNEARYNMVMERFSKK